MIDKTDRTVTRRDFLNGVSVAIGASLLPACSKTGDPLVEALGAYYPPAETGMRGSHPGSFEAAHATVQGQRWEAERTDEQYDLVVVGAGISGLSAAYIYRRDVKPDARILILDNHDDFGGHAKRNEFTLDGRTYLGNAGTMLMEAPRTAIATFITKTCSPHTEPPASVSLTKRLLVRTSWPRVSTGLVRRLMTRRCQPRQKSS
jgi:hypothetical protein